MIEQAKVKIRQLPTGVEGLDEILGGGLPEFSFNIIGGAPGCGKTTLVHQFVFANTSRERPALYFTILGEPPFKMLRYQQQYNFFDSSKLNSEIFFVNLSELAASRNLNAVLDEMKKQVDAINPGVVVVDSFRTFMWMAQSNEDIREHQVFVHRLAAYLASWQATTFLIGEYTSDDIENNPAFTVADGLIWLSQRVERQTMVRQLQVMKLRGQASLPGLHTIRITDNGLQLFPRTLDLTDKRRGLAETSRLSTGISELDEMMGGGIRQGDCTLIAGPSGSGKSLVGSHFIAEGVRQGEPGLAVVFEEFPEVYTDRARMLGLDLVAMEKEGKLKVLYLKPLDLSVDEAVYEIVAAIKAVKAKRLIIDSLTGFELAVAPSYRADFRESAYRIIASLTRLGVTIVLTAEIQDNFTSFSISPYMVSILTDNIIRLRYIEINGQIRKMLVVMKMRRSSHSSDMHEYRITTHGMEIGGALKEYKALSSGVPEASVPGAVFAPGSLPGSDQ